MSRLLAFTSGVLLLAACHADRTYVGVGDVLTVDATARQVTIRHDQIAGLLEAGTTRFAAPSDEVRGGLTPGARVRFELRRAGDDLELIRASLLTAGNPGIHDHTPHHGGVVAMVGMIHLEAKASPDGRVQLYLTDVWRRPLPLADVEGAVTLDLPEGKRSVPLVVSDDALEGRGPALPQRTINAAFVLRRGGAPVEVSFLLPLGSGASGAAGIPAAGCVAPLAASTGRVPRCTLSFAKPVAALAAAPDASALLVATVDLGISAWRLPAGEFLLGFAPAPPVIIPIAEPLHPEAANAVVVRPDGREAVVALENRLIRYAMDTGQVVHAFDGPGGIVRAVAWSPDGGTLLVSTFYNSAAFLLDAADGRLLRRFPVAREGAAVAFAPDGRTVAVGSEVGPIALFDVDAATPARVLREAHGAVRGLAFVGDRLVAANEDGVLRIWQTGSGALLLERTLGPTLRAMAVNTERGVVATVGGQPRIDLIHLEDGAAIETLAWHTSQILGLTWAGNTLVSGDSAGHVALWEPQMNTNDHAW